MCDIIEDTEFLLEISNIGGVAVVTIEVVTINYPSGLSALMRDISWLQDNVCLVVGVAGGVACLLIIGAQITIMVRHKRHGCQSFSSQKLNI